MTLDNLGNIGELIGAIGVIVTLVYLAMQIRQNTGSIRTAAFQEVIRELARVTDLIATDADLARIYRAGLVDLNSLEPEERTRFAAFMMSWFRRLEILAYQLEHGSLDSGPWDGARMIAVKALAQPGGALLWTRAQDLFSPDFRDFVNSGLSGNGGHAA